ncbi:MAG: hypothetical protein AB2799_19180 [Candidatus Thiodiazotropha sp.]
MRYELGRVDARGETLVEFRPFSLKLTFGTREEYVYFHDIVMPMLFPHLTVHQAMGDFYGMGRGHIDNAGGEIELPEPPQSS